MSFTERLFFDLFSHNCILRDARYQYEIATEQHREGMVQVFTDAFCYAEPMTQYLKIDPQKFKSFSQAVTDYAIQDQLSIVALDKNKVIACAMVEDFAAMHNVPTDFDPNFKYILQVLESLSGVFFQNKKFSQNMIAHLFITAVDRHYRQQGISTQVNLRVMELAYEKGFRFIYSELTNLYNEKGIFKYLKNNRKLLTGSCMYNQFKCEDCLPFENLVGSANGYLFEIKEGESLNYFIQHQFIQDDHWYV